MVNVAKGVLRIDPAAEGERQAFGERFRTHAATLTRGFVRSGRTVGV
jgi:hypothetical protein